MWLLVVINLSCSPDLEFDGCIFNYFSSHGVELDHLSFGERLVKINRRKLTSGRCSSQGIQCKVFCSNNRLGIHLNICALSFSRKTSLPCIINGSASLEWALGSTYYVCRWPPTLISRAWKRFSYLMCRNRNWHIMSPCDVGCSAW